MSHLESTFLSYRVVLRGTARFLLVAAIAAFALAQVPGTCEAATPAAAPRAGNTQFIFANVQALGSYDITKNSAPFSSAGASAQGSLSFSDIASVGDQYILSFSGVDPFPPGTPQNLVASGQSNNCARLEWTTPPPSDYVSGYRIYWGTSSGTLTDSTTIDLLNVVNAGATTYYTACGFAEGTYYFRIRAQNQFSLWSPISNEDSAVISGGTTQPPTAPTGVAVAESTPGCATITWNAVGDPTVTGYRAYYGTRSVAGGAAASYDDSVDVGTTPSAQACGLPAGAHYFSVKSRTAGGLLSAYSAEVSRTIVGADTQGPVIISMNPANGATNVTLNSNVNFVVEDLRSDVNISSLVVNIAGVAAANLHTMGTGGSYIVQSGPASDFPANTTIVIDVTVSDSATPPNETVASWSFQTGASATVDTDPPVLSAISPAPGATGVPTDVSIQLSVADDGLGIDLSAVVLFLNDTPVTPQVSGMPDALTITYDAPGGFLPGSQVSVRLEACDLAVPSNCASPLLYTFAVEQEVLVSTVDGAIVPDGFWADDPTRPLEVRNLPMAWSIRIFDTGGSQVRRFRNNASDNLDWIWDFSNDHGQRVARALYLVRVIDASGSVQRTGRFLVQSNQ